MKRCLTLGISLCLVSFLSGCCCNRGLNRCGGCSTGYAPACSPCGQPFGGFAPMGGCNSCSPGGAPVYSAPGYGPGIPTGYITSDGYTTAAATPAPNPSVAQGAIYPQADPISTTAYGQPAQFTDPSSPVTTALMKPESLATY